MSLTDCEKTVTSYLIVLDSNPFVAARYLPDDVVSEQIKALILQSTGEWAQGEGSFWCKVHLNALFVDYWYRFKKRHPNEVLWEYKGTRKHPSYFVYNGPEEHKHESVFKSWANYLDSLTKKQ